MDESYSFLSLSEFCDCVMTSLHPFDISMNSSQVSISQPLRARHYCYAFNRTAFWKLQLISKSVSWLFLVLGRIHTEVASDYGKWWQQEILKSFKQVRCLLFTSLFIFIRKSKITLVPETRPRITLPLSVSNIGCVVWVCYHSVWYCQSTCGGRVEQKKYTHSFPWSFYLLKPKM